MDLAVRHAMVERRGWGGESELHAPLRVLRDYLQGLGGACAVLHGPRLHL